MKNFYITTTAPYVNADPHIGFALEIIQADTVARYKRSMGNNVVFGFGTDEHGLKIYRKALEEGKDPQTYCDELVKKYYNLKKALNVSSTHFMRTTDSRHILAAKEFWNRCFRNGDIYKKNYRIKYCVGCELEKTDSELAGGQCPIHPNLKIENYEEENYFFRFSKYQDRLLELYDKQPDFVTPQYRLKEIREFVSNGLQDFSISRLKEKMPWGVDVPNDPDHVMYVWFDALVFYISTLGWPEDNNAFQKYWPGIQVAGKDNLRQQTAIWQAMLISAGLPCSKQVFIHGFITANGQKMSKSLGNVVDPFALVKKYGTDAVRYYLLREIPSAEDGDYSEARMKEIYNSDLANELGNLASRIITIAETDKIIYRSVTDNLSLQDNLFLKIYYEDFEFNKIIDFIWNKIRSLNREINEFAPWSKKPEERKEFLEKALQKTGVIGRLLEPIMPETAEKIVKSTQGKIKKIQPLFPRL